LFVSLFCFVVLACFSFLLFVILAGTLQPVKESGVTEEVRAADCKFVRLADGSFASKRSRRETRSEYSDEAGGSVGRPRMLGHFAFSDQSENRGATQGYASEARRFSVLAALGTLDASRNSYNSNFIIQCKAMESKYSSSVLLFFGR